MKVAVLGPRGTNTHEVARRKVNVREEDVVFCKRNEHIMERCRDEGYRGVVPIENSSEGYVREVVRFWLEHMEVLLPFSVVGETCWPISHALLLAREAKGDVSRIKVVRSHPQALGQCSKLIAELGVRTEAALSTAEAARELSENPSPETAVIASVFAAQEYGLTVACRDIQDYPNNATKFHVLGTELKPVTGNDKTTLLFEVPNRALSLASVLVPIGTLGGNLSSIHSIPLGDMGRFAFYVEMNLHKDSDEGRKALACLETLCVRVKVLGSYPQWTE